MEPGVGGRGDLRFAEYVQMKDGPQWSPALVAGETCHGLEGQALGRTPP